MAINELVAIHNPKEYGERWMISKADFDASTMELFDSPKPKKAAEKPKQKPKPEEKPKPKPEPAKPAKPEPTSASEIQAVPEKTAEAEPEKEAEADASTGADAAIEAKPAVPKDPDQRHKDIIAAIGTLDPKNESAWVKSTGFPQVKSLEAILAYDISANERDAGWIAWQEANTQS